MAPKRKEPPTSAENSPSKRVTRSTAAAIAASTPSTRSTRKTRASRSIIAPVEDSSSPESEDELDLLPSKSSLGSNSSSPRKGRKRARAQVVIESTPSRTRPRSDTGRLVTPRSTKAGTSATRTAAKTPSTNKQRTAVTSQPPPSEEPQKPAISPTKNTLQLQTPSSSPPPIPPSTVKSAPSSPSKRAHHSSSLDFADHLSAQKRAVLMALHQPQLTSQVQSEQEVEDEEDLPDSEVAFHQITDLLKGTVTRGEGNSCLLLGPRGSGKTHIVEKCISDLHGQAIVIRLSGWIQTNDRLAMREIARQLSKQVSSSQLPEHLRGDTSATADEDENPFIDTPSQNVEQMEISVPTAHLHTLISCIPTLGRPAVIVLDAFDLFALHSRQSLLYSLLDTVQSCKASLGSKGLAVIGVTTRMDTIVLLEKRVKSRFSGRMIRTSAPRKIDDWKCLTKKLLLPTIPDKPSTSMKDFQGRWKDKVEEFLDDPKTERIFEETFSITKDIRILARLLTSPILNLSPASPWLTVRQLELSVDSQRCRPQYPYLSEFAYPALCLLIASVHADTAGYPSLTFEMLHESVRDAIRSSTSAPVQINGGSIGMVRCSRATLMSAFEQLVSAKIFVAVAAPSSNIGKEFIRYRCALDREDIKKAVDTHTNLKRWLSKSQ